MATDVHGRVGPLEKTAADRAPAPESDVPHADTPARGLRPDGARGLGGDTAGESAGGGPGDGVAVAIEVAGLSRSFGGRRVIDDLDLTVRPGEFVALLGRSGCGKSTLLRVLAGLDREIEGLVRVPRARAVAFQQPRLMPWKRVWRNVLLGLPGRPDRATAERALAEVGLTERATAWPKTLSGGEAQRASLARALVREPDLLLLDEPFGALDALTRITAQRLVADVWQRRGCAVLLVTHDVDEAVSLADRVLVMDGGVIAYETPVGLDRPRDAGDPAFTALRAELLDRLGVATPTASAASSRAVADAVPDGASGLVRKEG
ncbi:ABC transporter ATP-binding protein [Streptomyces sp. 71268]|uniref:ABC transporter ATP-binding protein n=1 Tax=Streptomyces sp. 71268 TaxID=3002640 RepID=UPI0023FA4AAB|nr:ABC transporter ATP-binding protein [Streptomyces sp. 71268]WEV29084.1 ABC transporter ATP-binding protein [Streptomyces sp. 71268]